MRASGRLRRNVGAVSRRRRPGQAMIEMALVLPILCVLAFGMCDFGILMFQQLGVGNCARDVARRASVRTDPWPTNANVPGCGGQAITFKEGTTAVTSYTPLVAGDSLTVTSSKAYDWVVIDQFVPGLGPGRSMTASVTVRMEGAQV